MSQIEEDIDEQPGVVARAPAANAEGLDEACSLIGRARAVRFLAIGSSRHAAGYGAAAVDHLAGVPSGVLAAPGWGTPPPPVAEADVIVAVSQSGATPALVEAVAHCRDRGATVIAVTNELQSPLESLAQLTLNCGAGTERVVAATKSVTSAMVLLRAAAAPLEAEAVAVLRRALDDLLGRDLSPFATGDPPAWVVAGGIAAGWVADEVALKLAEVAGLVVGAESVVEFLHGPTAAAGPVLALVDPDDPNAARLRDRDRTVMVTPPCTGDPWLDPIVTLVAGQRLAVAWSVALHRDPDSPRGLAKVTRTT